jgi:hypothetical protein
MTAPRTTIAGIAIPDSALAREGTDFVRDTSTQLLFDHSRRVLSLASLRAEQLSLDYDAELLGRGRHLLGPIHELAHEVIRLSVIQAQVCHRTMLTS